MTLFEWRQMHTTPNLFCGEVRARIMENRKRCVYLSAQGVVTSCLLSLPGCVSTAILCRVQNQLVLIKTPASVSFGSNRLTKLLLPIKIVLRQVPFFTHLLSLLKNSAAGNAPYHSCGWSCALCRSNCCRPSLGQPS
jgi:hypothetical protein